MNQRLSKFFIDKILRDIKFVLKYLIFFFKINVMNQPFLSVSHLLD